MLGVTTANGDSYGLSLATAFNHIRLVASCTTGSFINAYRCLQRHGTEGIVLKCRKALYGNQLRPGIECRDWLKRRFEWDPVIKQIRIDP